MHTKTILTIFFLAIANIALAQKEPLLPYEWLEEKSKTISDLQYKANGQEIDFGDNQVVTANFIKENFNINFSDKLASVSVNFSANGFDGLIVVENIDLTRVKYLIEEEGKGILLMFPSEEIEWQLYMQGEPTVQKDKFFYFKAANEADSKKMFTTFWQIINRLKEEKGLISENEAQKQWKDWDQLAVEDFYIKYHPKSILAHDFNDEVFKKAGEKYYNEENYTEALKWYERAANLGNGYANYVIGHLYFNGRGVQKDYAKAFEYYLKGAEQGNSEALIQTGNSYRFGWGTSVNIVKAREFYQKAVDNGSTKAILNMADSYYSRSNPKEVMLWYQRYLDKGGKLSEKEIGWFEEAKLLYYKENPNELILWSQKHLDKGGELTGKQMKELGIAYYYTKEYQKSLEWLKKACDKGERSSDIGTTIREIYSKGLGTVEKDRKAGRYWEDKCY